MKRRSTLLCLLLIIILVGEVQAQREKQILEVGDIVPDVEFRANQLSSKKTRLSDFKGKWIILDFWSTWCGPCIEKLPTLDSIQHTFKNNLQVILINSIRTGDSKEKIEAVFKKLKSSGYRNEFASIVEDSVINELFPHKSVPHYVWISPDRVVRAISSSSSVDFANVRFAISNGDISLPIKKDFFPNRIELDDSDLIIDENLFHYVYFKRGRVEGKHLISHRYTPDQKSSDGFVVRGKTMRNLPLVDMFIEGMRMTKEFRNSEIDKRLLLDVADIGALRFDSTLSLDDWEKVNTYTYDLVVPENQASFLNQYILEDLNRYSDYSGKVEKRKVLCLILVRTSDIDKIKTSGEKAKSSVDKGSNMIMLTNRKIEQLVTILDNLPGVKLPVINSTNYSTNIDINLSLLNGDLNSVKNSLKKFDLDLIQEEREIDVFVIRDKSKVK